MHRRAPPACAHSHRSGTADPFADLTPSRVWSVGLIVIQRTRKLSVLSVREVAERQERAKRHPQLDR